MNKILVLFFLLIVALWFSSLKGKKENFIMGEGEAGEFSKENTRHFEFEGTRMDFDLRYMTEDQQQTFQDALDAEFLEPDGFGVHVFDDNSFGTDGVMEVTEDQFQALVAVNNYYVNEGIWNEYSTPRLRLTDLHSVLNYNFKSPLYTMGTGEHSGMRMPVMSFPNDSSIEIFERTFNIELPDSDTNTFTYDELKALIKEVSVDDTEDHYEDPTQFTYPRNVGKGSGRDPITNTNAQQFMFGDPITNTNAQQFMFGDDDSKNTRTRFQKMLRKLGKKFGTRTVFQDPSAILTENGERITNARRIRGDRIEVDLNEFINKIPFSHNSYHDPNSLVVGDVKVIVPDTEDWKTTLSDPHNIKYDMNGKIIITHTDILGISVDEDGVYTTNEQVTTYTLEKYNDGTKSLWILVDNTTPGSDSPVLLPNNKTVNSGDMIVLRNTSGERELVKVKVTGNAVDGTPLAEIRSKKDIDKSDVESTMGTELTFDSLPGNNEMGFVFDPRQVNHEPIYHNAARERLLDLMDISIKHNDAIKKADATQLDPEHAIRIAETNPGKYLIRRSRTEPDKLVVHIYSRGNNHYTYLIGMKNDKITILYPDGNTRIVKTEFSNARYDSIRGWDNAIDMIQRDANDRGLGRTLASDHYLPVTEMDVTQDEVLQRLENKVNERNANGNGLELTRDEARTLARQNPNQYILVKGTRPGTITYMIYSKPYGESSAVLRKYSLETLVDSGFVYYIRSQTGTTINTTITIDAAIDIITNYIGDNYPVSRNKMFKTPSAIDKGDIQEMIAARK